MYKGFVRVRSVVPEVKIGDVKFNSDNIIKHIKKAEKDLIDIMVFPELCVTGYTCADLFSQPFLIKSAEKSVVDIAAVTSETGVLYAVGLPVEAFGRLYNCAAVIYNGEILGIVPKTHIPNYSEFYEKRWFESGKGIKECEIDFSGKKIPFGTDLIFDTSEIRIGVEICEDLWVPNPPSSSLCMAGAEIILNLSASDELIGKHDYLMRLISQQSARCRCVYAYSSAGWGESSTDLVFSGNAVIGYDGSLKDATLRFSNSMIEVTSDVDIEKLKNDRRKYNSFFDDAASLPHYRTIESVPLREQALNVLSPAPVKNPFVPSEKGKLFSHCEEIVNIQSYGLMRRLDAIGCKKAVVGISGGLDSTLALLVTVKAFDRLNLDRKNIIGITMPGAATTTRTKSNAVALMEHLGISRFEIPIGKAVAQHFLDIGQDPSNYDVTYENSQARERTQILMDFANKENAIVIGTGDMSELALGWCTYNGDHMSMYAVNASVPKTLVKHLVGWFASEATDEVSEILKDIIATPISPELVPSGKDDITQKTEDLVGPYELHDFFLYHFLRNSFEPEKILWLAKMAFKDEYDDAIIEKWLRIFFRRFFSQQFKRSCMPDGPKVGSVCLSPRGDWRMPSDASSSLWLSDLPSSDSK